MTNKVRGLYHRTICMLRSTSLLTLKISGFLCFHCYTVGGAIIVWISWSNHRKKSRTSDCICKQMCV